MKLEEAEQYAKEVVKLIEPWTKRCEIAGSIRRKKATDIKDIEIVAIPAYSEVQKKHVLHWRIEELVRIETLKHGDNAKNGRKAPFGEKYYRLLYDSGIDDIKLDLFVVIPPAQWGPTFLIRTGDAEFSHEFVQLGWPNIKFVDGHMNNLGAVLETPEEIDVFKALKVPWIEPELRTTTTLRYVLHK